MSINYNPRISSDGLIFALDAANPKSYRGSGTTWSDISGQGGSATLTNGPTYSSSNLGSIVFDGIDDYVSSNSDLKLGNSFTISLWVKHNTLPSSNQNYISLISDVESGGDIIVRHKGADSAGKLDVTFNPAYGTSWLWGYNLSGSLGTYDVIHRSTPITTLLGGSNWKSIQNSGTSSVALKTDGTLWSWGAPSGEYLGRFAPFITPVTTILGGTNWADTATTDAVDLYTISSLGNNCAAVKTDGTLWVWGLNDYGQLGTNKSSLLGDIGESKTPVTTILGGTDWKTVSGGRWFMGSIKTDGRLWLWGFNFSGNLGINNGEARLTPVTTILGGTNWKQVSCSQNNVAAIKTDGRLWLWGDNLFGQLGNRTNGFSGASSISTPVTTFLGGTDWQSVSSGSGHTAAIKTDGRLWVWGANYAGELGINKSFSFGVSYDTPITTILGGTNWKQVSCGYYSTSAVKTDGTLWVWGLNKYGELGINDRITRSTPVTTILGGTNWKQVSSAYSVTAAVKTDGTLWTWGWNNQGQLGVNDVQDRLTPVTTLLGGTNWKQVSSGSSLIALNDDGVNKRLFIWGGYGLLTGTGVCSDLIPEKIYGSENNWASFSTNLTGGVQTAAIKTDGTLWTWGTNAYGVNGNNTSYSGGGLEAFSGLSVTPITTILGGTNWKQVSCGKNFIAATKTNGTLWNWGSNVSGQLGINKAGDVILSRSTPVTTILGGTDWQSVSCGGYHTVAIKTNGTLWAWGKSQEGQLGNNILSGHRSTPVTTILGGTNWKSASSGHLHTAAIKTDGTLWLWGDNQYGECGTNVGVTYQATPVTTILGGTNWKSVSCGYYSTSAVKTDGTLWVWGLNDYGQLGVNDDITRFTPITTILGGTSWKSSSSGFDSISGILGNAANVSQTSSLLSDTFYNIVATYDGSILRLYKNASFVSSTTATTFTFDSESYTISSLTEPFKGNIYHIMIHNRALTSTEISQNFNALRGRFNI